MNGPLKNVTRRSYQMSMPFLGFNRHDKDFQALQKVILEPSLLESMKYYMNRKAGPDLR